MKTEDEKLTEILVDALASALPGASMDELDTGALRDAVGFGGDLKSLHFFPPEKGVDPQAFVDAAARAVTAVNEGRSKRVVSFPRVGVPSTIGRPLRPTAAAIDAVANEIENGVTDFDELRVLATKHVFDAGGDPDDADIVDALVRCAELTANGSRVIGGFEKLVA